jgi:Na+-transporting methylmalonyl-CoA/oxaloacetate decarboxylase gamma subunit
MKQKPQTYQIKIAVSITGFVVVVIVLFTLVFPWLLGRLERRVADILDRKKTVLELRQEQRNMELAQQDLEELKAKPLAPDDLFSQDITLVTELLQLERKAKELNITLSLTVTGTVATATKAKTTSDLYAVPFSLQLVGRFGDVVAYTDYLEHAAAVMTIRTVSVNASNQDMVTASLGGLFYLRK